MSRSCFPPHSYIFGVLFAWPEGVRIMICAACGAEVPDDAMFCPNCGAAQQPGVSSAGYQTPHPATPQCPDAQSNQQPYEQPQAPVDSGHWGWAVLGFCIPIVGLVLYIVWRNEKPNCAKKAGIGALVSVIVGLVGSLLSSCMVIAMSLGVS